MVKNRARIKGIIFDLDGTLVHSTIDFAAMKNGVLEILHEEGVPREHLDPMRTTTENQLRGAAYIIENGGDARRAMGRTSRLMSEIEMRGVMETKQVHGALRALRHLKDGGMGLAVLTRGSRAYSTQALSSSGLGDAIDFMVCRDDHAEEEAKPAPISLRRAAAGIGFQAQDCLMVGDHMMDLECARAAGSGFIGVLSGSGDEHLWRREGVSMIVSDVGEIPKLLDVSRRD